MLLYTQMKGVGLLAPVATEDLFKFVVWISELIGRLCVTLQGLV